MEFDEIVVKESPGLCRCCLSEGCYKDLGSEYTWMNETEVYADMLLECFDIGITQHNEGPNGPNRLICEVCITRLRDACNFKKQVLDSEKKFIDMMGRGEFRPKMLIYQAQMKSENPIVEAPTEETEVEYLDDDIDFADDTEEFKDESEPTVSDITVSSLPIKGKRGRPKKTVVKTEKKAKISKVEEKPKSSKAVAKDAMPSNDIGSKAEIDKLRSYFIKILQLSTAVPFKIHENEYQCFYCDKSFLHPSKLREHNTRAHDLTQAVTQLIWSKFKFEFNVTLDIKIFNCIPCNLKLSNLHDLKTHFKEIHDEIPPTHLLDKVLCYKLNDDSIKCFLCSRSFYDVQSLLDHQKSSIHLTCQNCKENYCNKQEFLEHETTFCKPCTICDLRFLSKRQKDAHLKNDHSQRFKCQLCSIQFTLKETLTRHTRNIHYKEKNKTCDVCGKTFFDTHYLNLHKVSHQSTKPFECDICKKKFARKEALKLHKRIHNNDRRYTCEDCGKKFIQWSALHMHKLVHSDERNFNCPICQKAFKDKKTMSKHCKTVHQKE